MRYAKLAAVAAAAMVLAGCPEGDRDAAATGGAARDTAAAEQRADAAPGAQTFALDEFAGSGVRGEVRATPRDGQVDLAISIEGARPNATVPVSLHTGSCEAPGPEVADLGELTTDATGRGQTQTTVGLQAHQVLNGMHIVAAHIEGAESPVPIACSRVPEHRGGAAGAGPGAPRS
jgi:hypothetical protein